MFHVPPQNNEFEGEIIPCSDFFNLAHPTLRLSDQAFDTPQRLVSGHTDLRKAKRPTEISQSSGPIPLVADETVIKEWEDRMERDATTASSLEAKQDSGNINRTQSMTTLNESFP
ncbi:hypothetical protein Tco_0277591 [Tanacetum coccineum]